MADPWTESSIIEVARNLYSLSIYIYIFLLPPLIIWNFRRIGFSWMYARIYGGEGGRFAVCLIGSALSTRRFDVSFRRGCSSMVFSGEGIFDAGISVHSIEPEVEIFDANLVSFKCFFTFRELNFFTIDIEIFPTWNSKSKVRRITSVEFIENL